LLLLSFQFTLAQKKAPSFPFDKVKYQELNTIFTNSNRFVPGERILFRTETRLPDGELSFISKVGYVELVDAAKQSVLRIKIKIVNGVGQGHLYIPSHLLTGNYTLIAYTSWMMNYSKSFIPQMDIEIINPFHTVPSHLLSDSLRMTFLPEGNTFIGDKPNRVFYYLDKPASVKSGSLSVRLISPEGTEATQFVHDLSTDYGHFYFTPGTTGRYRIVATDPDDHVYFFDLMVNELKDFGISVMESPEFFEIQLTNGNQQQQNIQIVSKEAPGVLKSFLTKKDTTLQLRKSEWPHGVLWLFNENLSLCRPIYNHGSVSTTSIKFEPTRNSYSQREKIELSIDTSNLHVRHLSVSVRRVYDETFKNNYSSDFHHKTANHSSAEIDNMLVFYYPSFEHSKGLDVMIPEFRGQIAKGRFKDTMQSGSLVYISTIEKEPILRTARVNSQGEFSIVLPDIYSDKEFIVFTEGEEMPVLEDKLLTDYSFIINHRGLTRTDMNWLEQKAIDVQIEDGYFSFKADVALDSIPNNFFNGKVDKTFNLDAYTRFASIGETILEVIPDLRIRDNALLMPYTKSKSGTVDSALSLIDGLPAMTSTLLELDPTRIKSVELVSQQLNLGYSESRGIAMFNSFSGDAAMLLNKPGYSRHKIQPMQSRVKYYQPEYHKSASPMPDHRGQLYWNPSFDIRQRSFEFYTSDLPGTYEIVIQGKDDEGSFVYYKYYFKVN